MEWPRDFPDDHAFVELLVPGVSSDVDFETFLKVTEEKLSLNAASIEQQLKELQTNLGDSRTGDCPPSPIECLQWFRMQSCLRRGPKHQELMDFFKALHQYLKSEEEAKEEVTLHLIMKLSASCGGFPSSSSSFSPLHPQMTASSHLLHTVTDDTSLELQEAWDIVRLQLRRHLMDRLSSHSPDSPELRPKSTLSIDERVQCLQQLFFLYPETEVLTQYQVLKCQHVLGILHSSLCSSPGGETGFDRLAIGLSNVIPLLTQAITEELQVLSRLAEPHTILGFLNTAYLAAVVQELTTLVERERETAQRDHTALSSKFRKHSVKSRACVAPVEPPVTGRSFSLTSHQLRALTQLSLTLLRFEREVKELATNMTFTDCAGDTPALKGILKKSKMESDAAACGRRSTTSSSLHTPVTQVLEFNWRSAFKGLVPHMEHCVKVVLDDVCAKNLQQEEDSHSSGNTSVTLCPVTGPTDIASSNTHLKEDSFYNLSESETPTMIVKFCGAIMTELDALLPLAAACSDTSLLGVRMSFVAACGRATFAMLDRLQERALEVPSRAPLKNLPALLATCTYVHRRVQHYNARLKGSKTATPTIPLTLLPIQRCQDTVEAIREQLTSYCIQICASCIFQDAESHHWADPKPFYEGERCSFSVQMWFYFLCGLRSDLWAVLSPEMAKNVLGQVLSETLQLLVERYARARPSFRRHLQIRCDITAVLLYVEQLLWSVCESPEALVHLNPSAASTVVAGGTDWPYKIHRLCDQLLTVLVIVTAPLSLLHRTFMMDAAKDCSPQEPERPVAHWLNAINPDLFAKQGARDGLMGHTALARQLRLLTSDPGRNPKLLLRVLLYRDCHLPRLLLENSYFGQEDSFKVPPENHEAGEDFMVALFNLLTSLNGVPKALTMALQPYLERAHIWEHLYRLADTTDPVPVVIRCVRAIVTKRTDSILLHLVSMVQGWQTTEEPSGNLVKHTVPESVLAKIPKEWNYTHLDARGKDTVTKTGISLSIQALSFIFTNLPLAVASMPLPIRFLFQEGEKHLSQHVRQLRLVGLLLWAFLNCLIQSLEDPHTRENISGLALDRWAKERLSLLAECLQGAIGIQHKGIPKPTVHKVLQALEENRPKWINMQLQKARKLCSDSVFEQKEREVAAAELTEQKIGLMLLEVCHKAGGSNYLRQIYHIIQGNEELLMSKLSDSPDLPDDLPRLVNFDLGSEGHVGTNSFNPLYQFDHIGRKKVEQSVVVDWAWDWPRLLPAYQGMSQVTFKTLLANRWEMADDAELEDEEKAIVWELQKAFFVCRCTVGPRDPPEPDETKAEPAQTETQPDDATVPN